MGSVLNVTGAGQEARKYQSAHRADQARETRRGILHAARGLFIEQGYARTTIVEIARASGVSKESVYAIFKNKPTILKCVWDITIGGDDEDVLFHERPAIAQIRAEPDLARRLEMQAVLNTETSRRITPFMMALRGAAGADTAAAEMLAEIDRQRYEGLGFMAREAAATGQMAISEDECHDLMWATTDGVLWHRLVVERGWSDERFATYMMTLWKAAMLVGPDH
ncbi:TetR family transcriptional regulator [Gordonia sp. SL306]|uniref:TetR family transcriptional regulator n=1 Tax=Gordonia sp. SL306 TaxID=2995145 RepID=UPI00226E0AA9|nr:TetR family transcriptional regulator [Gordonia sp. SL306]WAC57590.1 TetR family transcriptional regulator [Gordonia sp. SL306]